MVDSEIERIIGKLRAHGWTVAVHNDYRTDAEPHTFWLWTHPETGRFVKGEGTHDLQALKRCEKAVRALAPKKNGGMSQRRREVIGRICRAIGNAGDGRFATDCICGEGGYHRYENYDEERSYRFDEEALQRIEAAIVDHASLTHGDEPVELDESAPAPERLRALARQLDNMIDALVWWANAGGGGDDVAGELAKIGRKLAIATRMEALLAKAAGRTVHTPPTATVDDFERRLAERRAKSEQSKPESSDESPDDSPLLDRKHLAEQPHPSAGEGARIEIARQPEREAAPTEIQSEGHAETWIEAIIWAVENGEPELTKERKVRLSAAIGKLLRGCTIRRPGGPRCGCVVEDGIVTEWCDR